MPGSPEWYRYQHELATDNKEHGAADQGASVAPHALALPDGVSSEEATGDRLAEPCGTDPLAVEGLELTPT